jgi:hypothetical protein
MGIRAMGIRVSLGCGLLGILFAGNCFAQYSPGKGLPRSDRPADVRPLDSTSNKPAVARTNPKLNRYLPSAAPALAPLTDAERAAIDSAMTGFGEKQADLVKLMNSQVPRLELLLDQLTRHEATVRTVDSLYAYPGNLVPYRDSVMHSLVRVRRYYEGANRQVREMHFMWLPHTMDLMAVYTRYGELSVLKTEDAGLRTFLRAYRQHYQLMDNLALRLRDLYNMSEYLLNAKLN